LVLALTAVATLSGAGCAATVAEPGENPFDVNGTELTRSQQEARMRAIRDQSLGSGLDNHWLLSAIAKCETQLAHCWSEATWACQGPASESCGGRAVIAGSGDGPCSRRQGGLGLFQFDAGNHDDTLRREGRGILTLEGNIDAAVDFTTDMVVRSRFIDGVSTRTEAIAWMNRIRPGGAGYAEWIDTVTGYYNGCMRGSCSIYNSRSARYRGCHQEVIDIMGEDFFFSSAPTPTARCGDATCDADETCSSCETDCGVCDGGITCGDGFCEGTESCTTCEGDCGPCSSGPSCGDGTCDGGETCSSCASDCGACAPRCGDGTCNGGETCSSCASDCGACPAPTGCGVAGHMSTTDGGSCSSPESWRCVFSPSFGANVSQVCRSGRWLNFHVDPRGCMDCCGSYSTSCRQSGA
jgi:hypothetical protein